jgi:hypothetical protein
MRKIFSFAAALALSALAWAGGPTTAPAPKKAPATKSTAATAVKKASPTTAAAKKPVTPVKKAGTVTTATARRTVKPPARPTVTWRTRQTAPTADRYKEIQDALVARGYLRSEDATGSWGPASENAMKQFQAEEALETSGKINSLSLIALGLGPKHDSITTRTVDGNVPQPESGRN